MTTSQIVAVGLGCGAAESISHGRFRAGQFVVVSLFGGAFYYVSNRLGERLFVPSSSSSSPSYKIVALNAALVGALGSSGVSPFQDGKQAFGISASGSLGGLALEQFLSSNEYTQDVLAKLNKQEQQEQQESQDSSRWGWLGEYWS